MTFSLTTLHVSNLDNSLAFYHNLLGLPIMKRFQAGTNEIAMLGEKDNTHLELIAGKTKPAPSNSISIGFIMDDLDAVLEACKDSVQGPITPQPNTVFWFVTDPDGYCVQLIAA